MPYSPTSLKPDGTWTCIFCFEKGKGVKSRATHHEQAHKGLLKHGWWNQQVKGSTTYKDGKPSWWKQASVNQYKNKKKGETNE